MVGLLTRPSPPVTDVRALRSKVKGPVGMLPLLLMFKPPAFIVGRLLILTLLSDPLYVMLTEPPNHVSAVRPFAVASAPLLYRFREPLTVVNDSSWSMFVRAALLLTLRLPPIACRWS